MKNILKNKYKLFTLIAAVTILFASCSNGNQIKNPKVPQGKARITFGVQVENASETMDRSISDVQKISSTPIQLSQIEKIVLVVKKYESSDLSQTPVDYFDSDKVCESNGSQTAYAKFTDQEFEFDFGWYRFDLELYIKNNDEYVQCYYAQNLQQKIDSSTTKITFNAVACDGKGDLSVKFAFPYNPEISDRDATLPIYKISAELYTDFTCQTPYSDSADEHVFIDDYSSVYNDLYWNGWDELSEEQKGDPANAQYKPPYEMAYTYTVTDLSAGKYYLKYVLYYALSSFGNNGPETLFIPFNTIGPVPVEMGINGVQSTIQIEEDDINQLPAYKGNFVFDSSLIDITCEPLTSDFYLNKGSVIFRVKDHDSNAFINPQNVSVELYYGNQELDSSYYTLDTAKYNGTLGEPDFDPYYEFKLKEGRPLLTGGKYQLAIIATKPAGETTDFNTPVFYSSRTIDIDVKPQEYFEFNAGDYDNASALAQEMYNSMQGLRNDASIRIYGTPNGGNGYYSGISGALGGFGNSLIDLDMSEMELDSEMDYHDKFSNFFRLRSVKLPAGLHSLSFGAIETCLNLEEIEFTIDDNYGINFIQGPIQNTPSLKQFKISNKSNKETNLFTLDDGKVLLSKTSDSTASIIAVASAATQITLPLDGDISVTGIDQYAFTGAKASSITGLDNITTIGQYAFSGNKSGASLYLPNVETIGDWAFYQAELTSITGLTKLTEIGNSQYGSVFEKAKITTITGLSNVTHVGPTVFAEADIKTFDFGPALQTIDNYAFKNSKIESLGTNVTGITSIGDSAFEGSNITAIPDLTHLTTGLGSNAFKDCKNLQTVTVDENFIDIMDRRTTYDSFDGCVTKNLIINCDFILSYSGDSYSMSYTIDNKTKTTSKISIIDKFNVTDTLTFNKKVTLPDLTYTNNPQDNTYGFFSQSQGGQGSSDWVGLAHLVFNDTSIIGKGQFNNFHYLSSITFDDANNLSEIGEQAFWLNSSHGLYSAELEENTDMHKAGTRRPQDIVLNGVRKIGYQAINKVTEEGTLTIPESVLAIQTGAFDGVMYGVAIVVQGQDGDNWLLLSGSNAEAQINTWLVTPESSLPAVSTDSEANPKIEKNDTTNDGITYDKLTCPSYNANGNKWYYRWTSN